MDIRVLSHREYVVVAMAQPFIMIMICLLVLCEITCCCNSVITQSACFLSSQQIVTMKYFHNCVGTEIIFSIAHNSVDISSPDGSQYCAPLCLPCCCSSLLTDIWNSFFRLPSQPCVCVSVSVTFLTWLASNIGLLELGGQFLLNWSWALVGRAGGATWCLTPGYWPWPCGSLDTAGYWPWPWWSPCTGYCWPCWSEAGPARGRPLPLCCLHQKIILLSTQETIIKASWSPTLLWAHFETFLQQ